MKSQIGFHTGGRMNTEQTGWKGFGFEINKTECTYTRWKHDAIG